MYGDEIKAVLLLEERTRVVGLDPFPRLSKGAEHDGEGVYVRSNSRWSRGKGLVILTIGSSKRRSDASEW